MIRGTYTDSRSTPSTYTDHASTSAGATYTAHASQLQHLVTQGRVAGVGWLSCTAAESLRAFVERVFANFRDKNVVFFTIA